MIAYVYLILHDITCIVGGVYLISIDHPWWAGALFLLAATTHIRRMK